MAPSRKTVMVRTLAAGFGMAASDSHGTNRTPSNRRAPVSVPSQKYPTLSCASEKISGDSMPSFCVHDVRL